MAHTTPTLAPTLAPTLTALFTTFSTTLFTALFTTLATLATLATVAPASTAYADEASPAPATAPVTDVGERADFLQQRFSEGQRNAQLWFWGFTGGTAALAVGQGVVGAVVTTTDVRVPALVGAGTALIGVLTLVVIPLPTIYAGDTLTDLKASGAPEAERLAVAEDLLRRAEQTEWLNTSWVAHTLTAVLALGSAAILWAAYDLPVQAVIQLVAVTAIGELRIWTLPKVATDLRRDYDKLYGTAAAREATRLRFAEDPLMAVTVSRNSSRTALDFNPSLTSFGLVLSTNAF